MKILVATSGVVPAKENAHYLVRVAEKLDAEIVGLHISRDDEAEKEGDEALKLLRAEARNRGVGFEGKVESGDVVSTIIACAEENDVSLILMGASQGQLVKQWLSAGVLSRTDIPVLVIPHGL